LWRVMYNVALAFAVYSEGPPTLVAFWLIHCLFTVLRPAQDYFTYMETSPLPMKGLLWHPGCNWIDKGHVYFLWF
jgi:hypothetical protein